MAPRKGQYLVLLCSRGQSVDLWAQLNKHLCDGPNPVMKNSVFIVLGTEVVLVLLTLLQCCYGVVFSKKKKKKKTNIFKVVIQKKNFSATVKLFFPNASSRWHCRMTEQEVWHVTDLTPWCVDQMYKCQPKDCLFAILRENFVTAHLDMCFTSFYLWECFEAEPNPSGASWFLFPTHLVRHRHQNSSITDDINDDVFGPADAATIIWISFVNTT